MPNSSTLTPGDNEGETLTDNLLLVRFQLDLGIRLDQDLDEHDSILMTPTNALHEPRIADAPLVLHVLQLRDVYARRAGRRRRKREPLPHLCDCSVTIWQLPQLSVGFSCLFARLRA
jgi:hypothetical protein